MQGVVVCDYIVVLLFAVYGSVINFNSKVINLASFQALSENFKLVRRSKMTREFRLNMPL